MPSTEFSVWDTLPRINACGEKFLIDLCLFLALISWRLAKNQQKIKKISSISNCEEMVQCSHTPPLVPKNLVLRTGHAGKLTNHTASRDSEHSPVSSVSGTCKLCLERLSYACLLGPQACLQLSVFLRTQDKGQGPSTVAHCGVHGAIWPPWLWNGSIRHGGPMYCKGLHLVYSFSRFAVSKCYTTASHAVCSQWPWIVQWCLLWVIPTFWPWPHSCYILSCGTAWLSI